MGRKGFAALAGLLFCCASAQAEPRKVCCFKITLTVSGAVSANYTRVQPNDFVGNYRYDWTGTAYGIAHLVGDTLITDRGAAAGSLEEVDDVKDVDGKRLDSQQPGCREQSTSATGSSLSGAAEFVKAKAGYPAVALGKLGAVTFSPETDAYELGCGSLATDALTALQDDDSDWNSPREFFSYHKVKGLSAGKLADRETQGVLCIERAAPDPKGNLTVRGNRALTVTVVPFPADDLKRQQRRLASHLGDEQSLDSPATRALSQPHPASNGCHKT